tara:strand:- start:262 stop:507 length:246 start_codon:yes stop_codon:yes gene_type:complete
MSDEISIHAIGPNVRYVYPVPLLELREPEFSEWQCLMFGGTRNNGLAWRPLKGGEPNWFWRKMQYLILGNKWVKDPKEKVE